MLHSSFAGIEVPYLSGESCPAEMPKTAFTPRTGYRHHGLGDSTVDPQLLDQCRPVRLAEFERSSLPDRNCTPYEHATGIEAAS